jgi:multiple sugar transport system permease protein
LTLVLFGLWAYVGGGPMVVFLAALQSVPRELYEAAEIDGAGRVRKFFSITIPMLTPAIFYSLILAFIGSFQVFDAAFIATQGGPGRATNFYMLYLFRQAFQNFEMGYASSLAWLLAVALMIFTAIQFRVQRYWVYYETER